MSADFPFLSSLGIAVSNAWMIAMLPVVLVSVYLIAIRHEEAYLTAKFGQSYTDYKSRVVRWL